MRVSDGVSEDRIMPVLAHTHLFLNLGPQHTVGSQQIFPDWEDEPVRPTGDCKEVSEWLLIKF